MVFYDPDHPKLRMIDAQPVSYEGASYLLLRDPLALTEKTILIPQPYIPMLALTDGTRNISTLRAALALRYGIFLTKDRIAELIAALDDALLLDNENAYQARLAACEAYRQEPFRPPASAGLSYPAEAAELSAYLQAFYDSRPDAPPVSFDSNPVRGLVSPHIDYQRGGPVYAQVWGASTQAAREAELAIIFGTDHFSEGKPLTLTRQNYATPFGVLPTDLEVVEQLAGVIGSDQAFMGELHHRHEHSIELAAVWLHHARMGNPIPMVPILCGPLDGFLSTDPNQGTVSQPPYDLEKVIKTLQNVLKQRRCLVIAAGDLAHLGPAFNGEPVETGKRILLQDADHRLINFICQGDAHGFINEIYNIEDANNVCGVTPIYLTLRLLAPLRGTETGYSMCPADQEGTSVVTICGVTLH